MKCKYLPLVITILFFGVFGTSHASLNLRQEYSFVVKGLSDNILDFQFDPLVTNGEPNILVRTVSEAIVYSPTFDSILVRIPSDSIVSSKMLFADVNRDSVCDIVFSRNVSGGIEITNQVIYMFDGASGFSSVSCDTLFGTAWCNTSGLCGIPILQAEDINGDGYRELIVSVDSTKEEIDVSGYVIRYTGIGYTVCYNKFPDSIFWKSKGFLSNIFNLNNTPTIPGYLGRTCTYKYINYDISRPGHVYTYSGEGIVRLKPTGIMSRIVFYKKPDSYCSNKMIMDTYKFLYQCSGNISNIYGTTDILAYVYGNFMGAPECPTVTYDSLMLFRFVTDDSTELVWSQAKASSPYYSYSYHPLLPGHFLGMGNGNLVLLNGSDGSFNSTITILPSGTKGWYNIFGDGEPRLVAIVDSTVSIYKLEEVTDIDDNENLSTLPSDFSIGKPYPNPFNASVIVPLDISQSGNLKLQVFNLLGEEVAVLMDQAVKRGSMKITWDATKFSSGVYMIRASSSETTRTARVVLLK
jgi:hypothetical protein